MYIRELPGYIQRLIRRELLKMGVADIELAMSGKVYDIDYLFEEDEENE